MKLNYLRANEREVIKLNQLANKTYKFMAWLAKSWLVDKPTSSL